MRSTQPWSVEKAKSWQAERPWLCGCNYLPSTAVNSTEMWQAETFDPQTITRELGWANKLGFNTIRIFLQYLVWKADSSGLKQRLEQAEAIIEIQKKVSEMLGIYHRN